MSKFSKLGRILPQTAKQYRLEEVMIKHQILNLWEEAAGAFVSGAAALTKAIDFSRGVLTVVCLSEQVAKEIRMFSERIIYAINQLFGKNAVFGIEIEV